MVGDAGGKAPAFARSVIGADNVARVLASIFPVLARIDTRVEPRVVNGQPGSILRDPDGNVVGTLTLDVLGGRIQTIRSVVNPDKLGHVGPVADAWAIAREVKQARRPGTDPRTQLGRVGCCARAGPVVARDEVSLLRVGQVNFRLLDHPGPPVSSSGPQRAGGGQRSVGGRRSAADGDRPAGCHPA
jgi:hypothetical protein